MAGGTTPNINASLAATGKISGRVTASDGATPLENIEVGSELVSNEYDDCWTETDANGESTIAELPAGDYARPFFDGALRRDDATAVPVVANATTPNINASLAPAGSIEGRVTNLEGQPLEGIPVEAVIWESGDWLDVGWAWTEANGEYEIALEGVILRWRSVSIRTYRIERSVNLMASPAFTPLATELKRALSATESTAFQIGRGTLRRRDRHRHRVRNFQGVASSLFCVGSSSGGHGSDGRHL